MQLQQESSPLASSVINYSYDAIGRPASRSIAGAGIETFGYDAIGRQISHTSDLGSFALTYLGQTSQITQRQLLPVSSNLATNWSYLPNSSDRRLVGISNTGLSTSQFSNFQFMTTPENFITGITQTSDSTVVYPGATTQTASYNNLNQLTNLSGQDLSYDTNGNLLSDGQRNYTWDAENRLTGITYPGQSGKATAFSYDGLSRRTTITSTPAGGGSSTATSYIWCGTRICQARNASNATTREYFSEGEFVPGVSAQSYYYGPDQIGSVRRVFVSASSAPAFSYDPWGNALQSTAPLTDFNYVGMFYNADSGLYLTQYRPYDPVAGRWLSRDPLGVASDSAANLYRYANGNPISLRDPDGRFGIAGAVIGGAVGGLAGGLGNLGLQLYRNGGNFGCVNRGQVGASALLGAGIGAILGGTFGLAGSAALALGDAGGIGGVDVGIEISAAEGATGLGDLTASEVGQIQNVVDAAGRPLDVVGSAARAARTATSDIDYTTANANFGNFEGLEGQLPRIDPEHGLLRGYADPNVGPSIRFEPGTAPYFVPGAP